MASTTGSERTSTTTPAVDRLCVAAAFLVVACPGLARAGTGAEGSAIAPIYAFTTTVLSQGAVVPALNLGLRPLHDVFRSAYSSASSTLQSARSASACTRSASSFARAASAARAALPGAASTSSDQASIGTAPATSAANRRRWNSASSSVGDYSRSR
jgi:hypothetical protein